MAFMGWRSIRHLSYFLVALVAFGCDSSPDEAGTSTGEPSTDASTELGNQDGQLARDANLLPDAFQSTTVDQTIVDLTDMQTADSGIADTGTAPDADLSGHPDMETEVPDAMVVTRCDPETEYEESPPTDTSDRICSTLTECHSTLEYEQVPATGTSDRVCARLTQCNRETEYEQTAPSQNSDRVCTPLTLCREDSEYEQSPPSPTADRVCSAVSECLENEYESSPPTDLSDRVCTLIGECGPNFYESVPATATTDRICLPLTTCESSEYESSPPGPSHDRQCATVSMCSVSEYELRAATPTSDRICDSLTLCSGDEYEATAPTALSDRVCLPLDQCGQNEFESTAPTPTSDRVCTTTTTCSTDEFELNAPTAASDRICRTLTPCQPNEYESVSPSETTDRVCQTVTECTPSQYELSAPTMTSDRSCAEITVCTSDEFEVVVPSETRNRECELLTVCGADQFESTPPTHNSDRICDDLTVCGQDEEESVPPTSTTDRQCEVVCDPQTVLQNNGCTSAGCHSPPVRANLDLTSPGFEANLLNAVSPTEGCEGRLIIDVERPEHSLLLQVVGVYPPLGGDIDTCQTVMPPWGGMSTQDQSCLSEWVTELAVGAQSALPEPDPFEATPIFSAMRKVKTLLHGDAPTSDELAQVLADPNALRTLVTQWVETEAFKTKMNDFFTVTLQQRFQVEDLQQFDRLRRSGDFSRGYTRVLEESFVRTALDIIDRDLPFTDVVTTRTWMVTTANLVLLKYGDQLPSEKGQIHDVGNDDTVFPQALSDQIAQRKWLVPSLPSDCALPQHEVLDMFFGLVLARRCPDYSGRNLRPNDGPLTAADFTDWRLVELVPTLEEPELPLLPFYDVESLRTATRVATRLPRVGFFTSSVFLNNWATNVDNQFRVTTNQSLLAALNIGFSSSEPTMPVSTDGLDDMHSAPGSACYGCHKQIDPMRLYFSKHFDINYQQPSDPPSEDSPVDLTLTPSFAFRNHTHLDGDLYDYANILTTHPRFPYAWVQKLCAYANSKRCDERDPLFLQIAEDFRDRGYKFKDLVIDLFSSPLVTGIEETETTRLSDAIISINRLNHLCPMLVERTGRADICDVSRVKSVRGLIARDDFARGAVEITQPALSSAFHFAAVEAICEAVSRSAVGGNQMYFKPADPNLVPMIVTKLMGIPEEHERYASTRAILDQHYEDLRAEGLNRANRARGVFTLACMSGDVMGVGL